MVPENTALTQNRIAEYFTGEAHEPILDSGNGSGKLPVSEKLELADIMTPVVRLPA